MTIKGHSALQAFSWRRKWNDRRCYIPE